VRIGAEVGNCEGGIEYSGGTSGIHTNMGSAKINLVGRFKR
jgi:hypothetical protein